MITLHQDSAGFIRMNRHFPNSSTVTIAFTDGTSEQFTGAEINSAYDRADADFRTQNHLDEKGFSRGPAKTVQSKSSIEFVPVQPGMGS